MTLQEVVTEPSGPTTSTRRSSPIKVNPSTETIPFIDLTNSQDATADILQTSQTADESGIQPRRKRFRRSWDQTDENPFVDENFMGFF